jgi:hypothetical protein
MLDKYINYMKGRGTFIVPIRGRGGGYEIKHKCFEYYLNPPLILSTSVSNDVDNIFLRYLVLYIKISNRTSCFTTRCLWIKTPMSHTPYKFRVPRFPF